MTAAEVLFVHLFSLLPICVVVLVILKQSESKVKDQISFRVQLLKVLNVLKVIVDYRKRLLGKFLPLSLNLS